MAAFSGRYSQKKEVFVKFSLVEDPIKECGVGLAYRFIRGGFKAIEELIAEDQRMEFQAIIGALYRDTVELKAHLELEKKVKEEAENFQVCCICATEIDLRMMGTYLFDAHTGMVKHFHCPTLKPKDQRDL